MYVRCVCNSFNVCVYTYFETFQSQMKCLNIPSNNEFCFNIVLNVVCMTLCI